ncbi:MAG: pilus (MSHA type) biogenesis protein MshL [Proteobacteria bacterium]|nr:pilus (MSHA type) biogenesis protein MshL [Pseudomonadota bacterium]
MSFIASCASQPQTKIDIKREIKIPEEFKGTKAEAPSPLKIPDFMPATEDVTPLKTRIVNITARNTPLRDVLHVIAEAASLNVVMEKGVDPETPVNITLKNVTAEHALRTIFGSVDFFYVFKENMLYVRATDTRIFELGHPALEQKYSIDVGGDMLAGATSSASGGGSSGGGGTGVKGSITQTVKSDDTAFKFWEAIEKSISTILGTKESATSTQQTFSLNRLAGSIIVTASKKDLDRVEQYINNLRMIIGRQVLVEAKIIEVQLNDNFKLGIDWSYITSDVDITTKNFASIVPATGPLLKIAVTDHRFAPVLQALQQQGEVRILSNPRINIMNGQTALLSVGRNTSFISKVETTTTGGIAPVTTYSVQTSSILSGILIGIVPYINERGEITLTVTPIISKLQDLKEKSVGTSIQISLPIVDLKELSTTVKVMNGQTIIIGGLIEKQESVQDDQVPFLGNIPLLGYFFKSRNKQDTKNELVVLLQPFLVGK